MNSASRRRHKKRKGGIKTSGIDLQADMAVDALGGRLSFNSVTNRLNHFKRSVAVGLPFLLDVRVGIDNLLDRNPPVVGGVPGTTDSANYDVNGRRYFAGFGIKF